MGSFRQQARLQRLIYFAACRTSRPTFGQSMPRTTAPRATLRYGLCGNCPRFFVIQKTGGILRIVSSLRLLFWITCALSVLLPEFESHPHRHLESVAYECCGPMRLHYCNPQLRILKNLDPVSEGANSRTTLVQTTHGAS